jgi:membrane protease YdiL (CAAX protease family)
MINDTEISPVPPRQDYWGAWATVGLGLVVIVVFAVVQSLVAARWVVLRYVADPDLGIRELASRLLNDGDLITAATVASAVVCTGLVFIIIKVRRGAGFPEYLALKPMSHRSIIAVIAVAIAFILLSAGADIFIKKPVDSDFMTAAYRSATAAPLFWMAVVVFAPLFEEIFIRGFLFIGLARSRLGPAGAVILTTLVWAALHFQYGLYEIAVIFVLGIILGVVRHRTGSLWGPVIIHAFNNLLAVLVIHLTVNGIIS